ncbi:hypothetical protein KL944_005359 [Ogataea haglerorum]|nr:hypothetical protein KL944_005359 [Ogataea haglerorum]
MCLTGKNDSTYGNFAERSKGLVDLSEFMNDVFQPVCIFVVEEKNFTSALPSKLPPNYEQKEIPVLILGASQRLPHTNTPITQPKLVLKGCGAG